MLVHRAEHVQPAYAYFAPHAAQMHSWCGDGDPRGWRYPDGARVVIAVGAASAEEARALADDLRRTRPE